MCATSAPRATLEPSQHYWAAKEEGVICNPCHCDLRSPRPMVPFVLERYIRALGLAALVTGFKDAVVPNLIVSMGCAEPLPTNLTVVSRRSVARVIQRGHCLTRAFEALGFSLLSFFQHSPSLQADILRPWRLGGDQNTYKPLQARQGLVPIP